MVIWQKKQMATPVFFSNLHTLRSMKMTIFDESDMDLPPAGKI